MQLCVCTLCISRQGFQGPGWASVGAWPGEGGTGHTPLARAGGGRDGGEVGEVSGWWWWSGGGS